MLNDFYVLSYVRKLAFLRQLNHLSVLSTDNNTGASADMSLINVCIFACRPCILFFLNLVCLPPIYSVLGRLW